jgi:acyl-CoA synthetase (AMP-forming)/AMP-acid ligase II
VVQGWQVMEGYFDDAEGNAKVFTEDGFLRTGDLGALQAGGYLGYRGRAKLMIKSGGENVSIEEVEGVLHADPALADAVVVPVPHERFGEVGFAFVRPHEPGGADPAEVIERCRSQLAGFKLPKRVEVVDELPRAGSGKVDRLRLTAEAQRLVTGAAANA